VAALIVGFCGISFDAAHAAVPAPDRHLTRNWKFPHAVTAWLYVPPEPPECHLPPPWTPVLFFPDSGTNAGDYRDYGAALRAEGFIGVILEKTGPGDSERAYAKLRAESADPASRLFGRVAPGGYVVAGHGSGAAEALAIAYGESRAVACAALDPTGLDGRVPGLPDAAGRSHFFPLLLVGTDAKASARGCLGTDRFESAYESAGPPKYRVTIVGGGHCEFSAGYAACRGRGCPPGSLKPAEQRDLAARVLAGFLKAHASDAGPGAANRFLSSLSSPRLVSHATVR